ncbi:tail fiber domain-containing protein [Cronobacter muytjensii]
MAKGTISINNGATTVNGDGTTFTGELVAGDYIVFTAGQVVYTLAVKTVSSDTALTLTKTYTGPDATGLAWSAVPRGTMSQITMEVVNQVTEALRGLNHDKANWQQVFSAGNNITVSLPDGRAFNGPSWPFIVNLLEDLDPDRLQQIVNDLKTAQTSVSADRKAAETARTGAQSAATSAATAQKAAESASAAATKSATSAATSASDATNSANAASQAATDACSQADRAELLADKFDAEKVLTKDANLSDVADKAKGLKNLLNGKPLPLSADAVSDGDAVTLRQLKASSGGGSGANMNGVMNDFIGAVDWFNGSRALLPSGYLAGDGQVLKRAEHADLWAAINLGMLPSVTDSAWLADPARRGRYSTGDGSTTFRMPDLNGVQSGSIAAPFLRGSGTGLQGNPGDVAQDGLPNIAGAYNIRNINGGGRNTWGHVGSFYYDQDPKGSALADLQTGSTSSIPEIMRFDASRSNSVYGRASEVQPKNVVGIWIIRANGNFVAANTNFNVINAYASDPGAGFVATGGFARSVAKIAGSEAFEAQFYAEKGSDGVVRATIRAGSGNPSVAAQFSESGEVTAPTFKPTDVSATWDNFQVPHGPLSPVSGSISVEDYLKRPGFYMQNRNAEAILANGYPDGKAGSLLVMPNGAGNVNGCTQFYSNYQGTGGIFFRRYLADQSTFESGGPAGWKTIFTNYGDVANTAGGANATVTSWNDIQANHVGFGYNGAANNPGSTGTCLTFSNTKYSAYAIQFTGNYASASRYFARSQNGDSGGVWQPWREFTMAAVSDERLKDVKGNFNVEAGLDNINRMEFKLFRYKWDEPERSARRGVIAQQIMQIDKEYVKDVGENMVLDQTPMLLDALAAIKALRQRDEDNKAGIAALEMEQARLQASVSSLIAAGSATKEGSESESVSGK